MASLPIPHGLPALLSTYGNPFDYVDRKETWEASILESRTLVTPLPYAYGPAMVGRIRAHRLVVDELVDLLADAAAIVTALGLPLDRIAYGGCYCWRPIRGSTTRLSTHTWGIAVDLDPARNQLGMPHDPETGLPFPVVDRFEAAGWTAGLRWNRPDPQHFQRAGGV
jgi:hypothetical protein